MSHRFFRSVASGYQCRYPISERAVKLSYMLYTENIIFPFYSFTLLKKFSDKK